MTNGIYGNKFQPSRWVFVPKTRLKIARRFNGGYADKNRFVPTGRLKRTGLFADFQPPLRGWFRLPFKSRSWNCGLFSICPCGTMLRRHPAVNRELFGAGLFICPHEKRMRQKKDSRKRGRWRRHEIILARSAKKTKAGSREIIGLTGHLNR